MSGKHRIFLGAAKTKILLPRFGSDHWKCYCIQPHNTIDSSWMVVSVYPRKHSAFLPSLCPGSMQSQANKMHDTLKFKLKAQVRFGCGLFLALQSLFVLFLEVSTFQIFLLCVWFCSHRMKMEYFISSYFCPRNTLWLLRKYVLWRRFIIPT